MTAEQLKEIEEKAGAAAAKKIKEEAEAVENRLTAKLADVSKGLMTEENFNAFKNDQIAGIQKALDKLDEVQKEFGNKVTAMTENAKPNSKSFEQYITDLAPKIKDLRKSGSYVEITGAELKAAGVTSIPGSIQPMDTVPGSPYAPGISNDILQIFDIVRNPNYILEQVDLGRTNSAILAWANETVYEGAPAEVAEGQPKPQTQHKFKVEVSTAKKMAAWINITEEFEQDLPGFATQVRRMLQDDVIRGWDNAIQQAVIDVATGWTNTGLNDQIRFANYWDALLAMVAQVRINNFIPNTIGLNPNTNVMLKTSKNENGTYLLPPFVDEINNLLTQANKVSNGDAFVGDLKQYKVDVYKDFVLKLGWINDDLIRNQFTIVGEVRYHRYISDARKKAIIYDSLENVANKIDGVPHSA